MAGKLDADSTSVINGRICRKPRILHKMNTLVGALYNVNILRETELVIGLHQVYKCHPTPTPPNRMNNHQWYKFCVIRFTNNLATPMVNNKGVTPETTTDIILQKVLDMIEFKTNTDIFTLSRAHQQPQRSVDPISVTSSQMRIISGHIKALVNETYQWDSVWRPHTVSVGYVSDCNVAVTSALWIQMYHIIVVY